MLFARFGCSLLIMLFDLGLCLYLACVIFAWWAGASVALVDVVLGLVFCFVSCCFGMFCPVGVCSMILMQGLFAQGCIGGCGAGS